MLVLMELLILLRATQPNELFEEVVVRREDWEDLGDRVSQSEGRNWEDEVGGNKCGWGLGTGWRQMLRRKARGKPYRRGQTCLRTVATKLASCAETSGKRVHEHVRTCAPKHVRKQVRNSYSFKWLY